MTIKDYYQKQKSKYALQRKASQAFKGIVAERTLAARRRAYASESLKVAAEQGAARARQPSVFSQLGSIAANKVFPVRKPIARRSPVRRRVVRRRAPRRSYGYAPQVPYGYAPVRRAPRRRARRVAYQKAPAQPRQQQQQPIQPFSAQDLFNLG